MNHYMFMWGGNLEMWYKKCQSLRYKKGQSLDGDDKN